MRKLEQLGLIHLVSGYVLATLRVSWLRYVRQGVKQFAEVVGVVPQHDRHIDMGLIRVKANAFTRRAHGVGHVYSGTMQRDLVGT